MVPTEKLFENEIYVKRIKELLDSLKIIPNNLNNYLLAFVHKSLVNEKPDLSSEHNERLEFLGDAVLELCITHKLFLDYSDASEGDLTNYRSSIVKGKHLADVAKNLGFQKYLILGKGEDLSGGREKEYILANSLEAFIGALYLDLGYNEAEKFILKNIYSNLEGIIKKDLLKDYKSLFQEYTQRVFSITPQYKVLDEFGEDHNKTYISGVFLGDILIKKGQGTSKKKSQEDAAKNAFLDKENIKLTN